MEMTCQQHTPAALTPRERTHGTNETLRNQVEVACTRVYPNIKP
jgi:hypothetical protein